MTRATLLLCLVLSLALAPGSAYGQEPGRPTPTQADSAPAPPDTFSRPPISAGGAFWRSLVLPGWAQAELGHEARGAFYFLAETFSLFMIARTQTRLDHAERNFPEDAGLIDARKQQREDWIALAVFWALFSAADGWVSVQLYGMDERTGLGPPEVTLEVSWRIPFGP